MKVTYKLLWKIVLKENWFSSLKKKKKQWEIARYEKKQYLKCDLSRK